jgi:hypothetical protein
MQEVYSDWLGWEAFEILHNTCPPPFWNSIFLWLLFQTEFHYDYLQKVIYTKVSKTHGPETATDLPKPSRSRAYIYAQINMQFSWQNPYIIHILWAILFKILKYVYIYIFWCLSKKIHAVCGPKKFGNTWLRQWIKMFPLKKNSYKMIRGWEIFL